MLSVTGIMASLHRGAESLLPCPSSPQLSLVLFTPPKPALALIHSKSLCFTTFSQLPAAVFVPFIQGRLKILNEKVGL